MYNACPLPPQVRATIFLVNNNGYTIEVQIHDGPYNDIKCWDYAGLMHCFNAGEVGHRFYVFPFVLSI